MQSQRPADVEDVSMMQVDQQSSAAAGKAEQKPILAVGASIAAFSLTATQVPFAPLTALEALPVGVGERKGRDN